MKDVSFLVENGIDVKGSLELFGDMDMYNETASDFLNSVPKKLADIKKYKEASDMPNYAILVHSLKSDSKYLGFTKLAELAYNHEMKSKANDITYVYTNYDELMREANRIVNVVKEYMGMEVEQEEEKPVIVKDKTILVVDDSNIIRNFIKKIFNDTYEVIVANDGREAIDAISLNPNSNIVGMLLDLNMPNVNGYEVLEYFDKHNLSVPKTYDDLLKSEYKNLIAIPDPKTSGTGYAFYLNAVNIMGEDKAIEYFKKLKNNLREFTTSGSGPTNLLKQGEIAIAMGMTSQGVEAINEGYNFKIVSLKTGAPYNTTSFGIIKGRENKENVREVFEWLMNDFGKYDKEYFLPDKILKNQEVKVKNYPTNLKDAKMDGVDSVSVKQDLISKWEKVNG